MNKTKEAVEVFDKHAQAYADKFMDISLYHDSLDVFCGLLKDNATILELACGPGNITKYMLDKRPDLQLLGTDLSANMLELAKTNNPAAAFQLMDCRDIAGIGRKYDGIVCGFCMPYLSKQEATQLIKDAAAILNNNGALYISTMEDDHNKSGYETGSSGDSIYMYYHEAGYLLHALAENGFTVIDLQRKQYAHNDGVTVTDLLITARK
ncbi:MAG: methyltransferase domain-containing protein [Chitinophagaceae bacterium]|nr:methyltransferase domain-containing protein [Chitinophagaceae bacterium]MCB9044790.1 methyltransferase domain-containing protein [Chitinophagales bacterium]